MYVLTEGDERFITESTTVWRMYLNQIIFGIGKCPHEIEDRIDDLEKDYRKGFRDYFLDAKGKDEALTSDVILNDFDAVWSKIHPQFYDMEHMFDGINKEDLAKADRLIKAAKEAFQG